LVRTSLKGDAGLEPRRIRPSEATTVVCASGTPFVTFVGVTGMSGSPRTIHAPPAAGEGPVVEDLRLRNYDHHSAHLVEVTVRADGDRTFQDTYRIPPGETVCVVDALGAGDRELAVVVDGDRHDTLRLPRENQSPRTAVVELGNGAVSLTADRPAAAHSR